VQLGFENKNQARVAIILGIVALIVGAYELVPFFTGSSTPASRAEAAAPSLARPAAASKPGTKGATKPGQRAKEESLDPTLRLDLLAMSEKTQYEGAGRNIFVSQREEVQIPTPVAPAVTEQPMEYRAPAPAPPPAIPLKFYGFANSPGEPKKVFLKNGDDVFVAGEGEIVDRRYKVIRITATSVEIQDMVYSGPPQMIPLTQG
jgi:hypothetical protein